MQPHLLSEKNFFRLSEFIYNKCGIKLTDTKRTMLESRLQKRLKTLGLVSFPEYCDYLFSQKGMEEELVHMIDQVTTNKTDFFREPGHFKYLSEKALSEIACSRKTLTVWSAGCSTGEEPYTLAMVLAEHGCPYTVIATDISTRVLEHARKAVYTEERVQPIPDTLKKKYLLRSRDKGKGLYRIVPELRATVHFRRLNFMDDDFGFKKPVDIIFCRNVIIYFDRSTQEKLLNKFCKYLSPHGYIFMGHSETLFGMDVPLTQIAPTIYRGRG